jgi:hypothetical protein
MKATEILSLFFSAGALLVSCLSWRVSRRALKIGSLSSRLEAMTHVREAINDVTLHGVVNAQTAATLREAFQLSSLVFNRSAADTWKSSTASRFASNISQPRDIPMRTRR